MRWLCGTVILACVFVCATESKLATVACLSWLTLTTWSYLHHAHSAPLDTHMHTHISVFVSLSFVCVCVLTFLSFLHSTTLSLSLVLLFISFLSLCLCVPSGLCVCPMFHCFQKVKLCLTGSRWQAGMSVCVCLCTRNHCYQGQVRADTHTEHLPAVTISLCSTSSSSSYSLFFSRSLFLFSQLHKTAVRYIIILPDFFLLFTQEKLIFIRAFTAPCKSLECLIY